MKTVLKKLTYIFIAVVLFASCSSLDCPMNSHVYANYGFYVDEETPVSLNGLLSVSVNKIDGNDTTLLNKKSGAHSIQLPMSYTNPVDQLNFMLQLEDGTVLTDVVSVEKTNDPHFESVECGANFFHTLTGISSTNNFIDSVVIKKNKVNYDATQEHVYIYVKH